MPIQDSDSDGSDASLPSDSCTVSSEVQRAARSELARQMEHSKELQTALEASRKEIKQLQDRISKLETIYYSGLTEQEALASRLFNGSCGTSGHRQQQRRRSGSAIVRGAMPHARCGHSDDGHSDDGNSDEKCE